VFANIRSAPRDRGPARGAITESINQTLDALARLMPGKSEAVRRKKAIAMFASMAGALITARAVNDPKRGGIDRLNRKSVRAVGGAKPIEPRHLPEAKDPLAR
jgi:hypothetical protein